MSNREEATAKSRNTYPNLFTADPEQSSAERAVRDKRALLLDAVRSTYHAAEIEQPDQRLEREEEEVYREKVLEEVLSILRHAKKQELLAYFEDGSTPPGVKPATFRKRRQRTLDEVRAHAAEQNYDLARLGRAA